MSQGQYNSSLTLLSTVSDLIREQYAPQVADHVFRYGQITNRIFRPSADGTVATGDGLNIQVVTGYSDSARATRNTLSDFGSARQMNATNLKLRFQDDPSSTATGNDFLRIDAVAEITEIELRRGNDAGAAVNLAERVGREMRQNYDDTHPRLYYSDGNGKFAAVNGAPRDADDLTYEGASSYTSGSTTFIAKVDYGSIAAFKKNTHWDFYDGDTLTADECRVVDQDYLEGSVTFELTDKSTVANCDNVGDNDDIYASGEKGNGYRGSLREWFDAPSSGEAFLGGVDRTTSAYRYLNPVRYTPSSTATTVNRDQLDTLALAMGYVDDGNDMGSVVLTNTSVLQTLRKSIGEEALSNQPADNNGNYSFGTNQLSYIHPTFGKVTLLADTLHPADRMHFLRASDWQLIPYLSAGLNMMDGDVAGGFYRKQAASGGGGRSMYYCAEGYSLDTLFCKMPQKQGVILNIKA